MRIEEWPKSALEADVPAIECPSHVTEWIERLPLEVFDIVTKVAEHGGGIWIVGGAVRDACLGLDVHDIDFAVSLEPKTMMEIFPDAIPTGIEYGTVSLRGNDALYEATTLRIESNYADGRRPEQVKWGSSLSEDLQRRDFTINAMAIDVARKVMHDPHFGLQDIERGLLRAVGQAHVRLSEDALRILRAYRFLDRGRAGVWNFDFELSEALRQNAKSLSVVTHERIWMEWLKILNGMNVGKVVERMAHDGVLDSFLPGKWASRHVLLSALQHQEVERFDGLTRFALLLCETQSIEVESVLSQLKLSNKQRNKILETHTRFGTLPLASTSRLRVFRAVLEHNAVVHLKLELVLRSHGLSPANGTSNEGVEEVHTLLEQLEQLPQLRSGHAPIVDGHWIMQRTGLGKGRALGKLKDWLHRLQIERDLASAEELEEVLCSLHWVEENHLDWPSLKFPE
ncbi:MAG: hypothetical protein L7U62_06195 [Candidatus Poseidoniaceae archaeon]|nr:hypothetical protein [Candidatus Poseidoniaceae archaeon]